MNIEKFQQVLLDLNQSSRDIQASALTSIDGVVIASALLTGVNEDRIGAMSATLLLLGEKTIANLHCGHSNQVMIEGEDGCLIITSASKELVLTLMTRKNTNVGMILSDIKRAIQSLKQLMTDSYELLD